MARTLGPRSIITRAGARFIADEKGATSIEYALIAAGIAVVISATVFGLGSELKTNYYDKLAGLFQLSSVCYRPAFSPAGSSLVPSASARRCRAEPGASGFCWLACGAQPESQTISKVARTRPSRSEKRSRVDLDHPRQGRPLERAPAALDQRIGRAHAAQVVQQRDRRRVPRGDAVDVGHRQREARALQQRAHVAHVGEGNDARRDPALDLGLGGGKGLAQLGERIAAGERRQQQPVGRQRAADLDQRAGKVVHELQRQRGHHQVERGVAQR